jgi:hypothetical protein
MRVVSQQISCSESAGEMGSRKRGQVSGPTWHGYQHSRYVTGFKPLTSILFRFGGHAMAVVCWLTQGTGFNSHSTLLWLSQSFIHQSANCIWIQVFFHAEPCSLVSTPVVWRKMIACSSETLYTGRVLCLFRCGRIHPCLSKRGPQGYKWVQFIVTPQIDVCSLLSDASQVTQTT